MSYASPADVEVELGRPASDSSETNQWQAWLDRVEHAIERAFRAAGLVLDDQVALNDPTVDDVIDVEVAAVIRKIQNPTWGETSVTKSVDDASVTRRVEGLGVADPLALMPSELNDLLPASNAALWSTRPGFESDTAVTDSWV